MEKLETSSNCSMLSDCSEYQHSNVSSLSGLSGYEDELGELKRLISIDPIHDLKYTSKPTGIYTDSTLYETRASNFKLNQNNKLKNESNIGRQFELESHKTIDKLIKHNAYLESQLKKANDQIGDLLKNRVTTGKNLNNTNISDLKNEISVLEKSNFEYNLQIQVLKKEVLYWQDQLENCDSLKRKLEKEYLEINQDNDSKINCIKELKNKICQQHTDVHNLKQENIKLNNQLLSLQNDLDRLKKSEEWYKHHLHQSQTEKQDALKECLNVKLLLVTKTKEVESLTFELNKWKSLYDEIQNSLNEVKQEQSIKLVPQVPLVDDNKEIKSYYESIISDLANEIETIKQSVQQNNITFDKVSKEKFDLLGQVTILQQKLNENEIAIQTVQNEKNILGTKLILAHENQNESEKFHLAVKNEKVRLEVELIALSKEKEIIEDSVTSVREDLNKLICKYKTLQQQLQSKDAYIIRLKKEKRELFINNNWQCCEDACSDVQANNNRLATNNLEYNLEKLKYFIKCLQQNIVELENEKLTNKHSFCEYEYKQNHIEMNNFREMIAQLKTDLCACGNLLYDVHLQLTNLQNNSKNHNKMQDQFESVQNIYMQDVLKILLYISTNLSNALSGTSLDISKNCILPENSLLKNNVNAQKLLQNISFLMEKLYNLKSDFCKEKEELCANSEDLKHKFSNIHKVLMSRVQKLETKCNILTQNNEESYSLLKLISSQSNGIVSSSLSGPEEIKRLKVIIKANEIEMREKQKRYETNNSTLLRKVKEHMRGRKVAEKQCLHVQDLYDALSDEYNMFKLQFSNMQYEFKNGHTKINNSSEDKSNQANFISDCLECKLLYEKIKNLQEELDTISDKFEKALKEKDCNIAEYQVKIQELCHKIVSLENENKLGISQIEKLHNDLIKSDEKLNESENSLDNTRKNLQHTEDKLLNKMQECLEYVLSVDSYKCSLKDVNEKNEYLLKEIESLSGALHQKSEELSNLRQKYSSLDEATGNFQTTVAALKSDLQSIQVDMNAANNDKHFLQRICNDLKFALHSSLSQNKVLKEQIQKLTSSKREYASLPEEFLSLPSPGPTKYDDTYIEKLLEQTSAPSHKLLNNIKSNLHLLKGELGILQKRISEKNFSSN